MIKVKRLDCPDVLKTGEIPEKEGEWETRDAIKYYGERKNWPNSYQRTGKRGGIIKETYLIYKHKEVRNQLVKMFQGKCAYCESKITTIYSGDIEHFRPKGGYGSAVLVKPGYYWLASTWDNLLFACPFCNQTNTHEIAANGKIIEAVMGKLNQFPLQSETNRLQLNHGQLIFTDVTAYNQALNLEESDRLLLKPCTDTNIEKHFKYNEMGLILPNDGLSEIEDLRAKTSITVYALQRITLVQAREEKVIKIKAQIRRVEEATINYNDNLAKSNETKTWFEGILRKEMIILKEFKMANQEYAGLARYLIDKFINNL